MADTDRIVKFRCIKEGSRLIVRVTSPGYQNGINCQFPRSIRKDGGEYWSQASAVTLARGPAGKYFYRVKPKAVHCETPPEGKLEHTNAASVEARKDLTKNVKVYEDKDCTDCVVCFDLPKEVVIVPCGHYALCKECIEQIIKTNGKCPLCRGEITLHVSRNECQGWEDK